MQIAKPKLRLLSVLTILALFISILSTSVAQVLPDKYLDGYTYVEFTFTGMTTEQAQYIIAALHGNNYIRGGEMITPFFLTCTLFGHVIQTGSVTQTTHNFYPNNPRCRVIITDVEFCTRPNCSHFIVTRETVLRHFCC